MSYPEDAIQSLVAPWWTSTRSSTLARGRLVYAFVQRADAHSFALTVEGRKEPAEPASARMRLSPLRSDAPPKPPSPPSPAVPLEAHEAWCVRRADLLGISVAISFVCSGGFRPGVVGR